MAEQNYIVLDDIKHGHIKQFPDSELQVYVDESNDYYEELARDHGITDFSSIVTPVELKVKTMLLYYLYYRFGEDRVGTNNVEVLDDDIYVDMRDTYNARYNKKESEITPQIICGTSLSRESRSVGNGKITRTG